MQVITVPIWSSSPPHEDQAPNTALGHHGQSPPKDLGWPRESFRKAGLQQLLALQATQELFKAERNTSLT